MNGKKTYLAAGAMVVYAIGGLVLGYVEAADAWRTLLEAAAIFGLRHGIKRGG